MYNSNFFITESRGYYSIINRTVYIQIKGIMIKGKFVTNICVGIILSFIHTCSNNTVIR